MKMPFEYVRCYVDHFYDQPIDENDLAAISEQCKLIAKFINSCGWDEESYFRAMINDGLDEPAN